MERTLKIVGNGNLTLKANLMILTFSYHGIESTHDKALKEATSFHKELVEQLKRLEIEEKNIITSAFSINQHYVSEKDKNGNYKNKLDGFSYQEQIKVNFDFDLEKLNKVLSIIYEKELESDFNLAFGLKNENGMRELVLKNAVEDALNKAKTICQSANISLGDIINIEYGNHLNSPLIRDNNIQVATLRYSKKELSPLNITQQEIVLSDNINVTFEIK